MIEGMLRRFYGAVSYENGINIIKVADFSTNGSVFNVNINTIPEDPCPIIATLKTTKEVVPYEDEVPLHFEISYKNQNDVTHTAYCVIPVYAQENLDFRIIMEEQTDYMKEILSISPRTGYTEYKGDLNDKVEIWALCGNIAKLEAAICVVYSEALYNLRIAGIQNYIEMAYSGGLKKLSNDYGLNLGSTYSQSELRFLTRIFASFAVPAKTVMQESMTKIYGLIDPTGTIEVVPTYSDSAYRMDVNVYISKNEFTPEEVALLVLFTERYRPVPASAYINIIFPNYSDEPLSDEGSVVITESTVRMSISTIMSATLLMGAGNIIEPSLPYDY